MALLSVIRHWHFRDGMPIREIERRTGLSRNTIRKYLRADSVEPKFKVPDRPSKLDPFAEKLAGWLKIEAGKSRKQKRTVKQLHAELVSLGYGSSDVSRLGSNESCLLVEYIGFLISIAEILSEAKDGIVLHTLNVCQRAVPLIVAIPN